MAMIAGSVTGFMLAEGERTRVRYVQAMRRCLMRMNDIVRYEQPDLKTLLLRINLHGTQQDKQLTELLHATAGRLEHCTNPQLVSLFTKECAKRSGYGVLGDEDRSAFEMLLAGLGRTGLQEQLRLINEADERLGRRERELADACERKARLLRTLGTTGGAAAFLLLI